MNRVWYWDAQSPQVGQDLPARLENIDHYLDFANYLGVDFVAELSGHSIIASDADCLAMLRRPNPIVSVSLDGIHASPRMVLAPSSRGIVSASPVRDHDKRVRDRFRLMSHFSLRSALFERAAASLTQFACDGLAGKYPHLSAMRRLSSAQAFLLGILLLGLIELLIWFPVEAPVAIRFVGVVLFFACAALRLTAALASPGLPWPPPRKPGIERPVYTVLVALRNEAAIIPQLMTALGRLVWPRDRLEIKLICEEDDHATIEAIRVHQLRDFVEVIIVPPSQPMTKPKALRYALPTTTGEFVVLYDAEDEPHPLQLEEAWRRFEEMPDDVACLQAPLRISNGSASLISRLFAFEYAGLFNVLLPWLAQIDAVLPLGGTSNHFRRSALDEVGAWDPHNVTEDADLGVRLRRFGYRCDLMALPTKEDAPVGLEVWFNQRTRWCKGWLQTWLVHMRKPWQLLREMGPLSFLLSQIMLFGIVFSVIIHPLMLVGLVRAMWAAASGAALPGWEQATLAAEIVSVATSYASFWIIGWRGSSPAERQGFWRVVAFTPVYWLMMSAAAWRSIFELWWRPFHWMKTPHTPRRTVVVRPPAVKRAAAIRAYPLRSR